MALTLSAERLRITLPQEYDLSHYREKLLRERKERTNQLRRINFDTKHYLKNKLSLFSSNDQLFGGDLTTENVIQALNGRSHQDLLTFNSLGKLNRNGLYLISNDENVISSFLDCFSNIDEFPKDDAILLLNFISFIFPYANNETHERLSDEMIISFMSLLEDSYLNMSILVLIEVMARHSTYARDSMNSFGIQSQIIEMIKSLSSNNYEQQNVNSFDLLNLCCSTIISIFGNTGEIDDWSLQSNIDTFLEFLNNPNKIVKITGLDCLTDFTNQKPATSVILNNKGICSILLDFLDDQQLVQSTLQLIGNVCSAQPSASTSFLQNGTVSKLLNLIHYEQYVSEVFWIFSNMLETIPQIFASYINDEFLSFALKQVNSESGSRIDIKKEAAFFLCTCVMVFTPSQTKTFINDDFMMLIDEMLSSGKRDIVIRCIDTLYRLLSIFRNDEAFLLKILMMVEENEIPKELENLMFEKDKIIAERSAALHQMLQCLLSKDE